MAKSKTEFAREINDEIREQLSGLDPLVDAYQALSDGEAPPAVVALLEQADRQRAKAAPAGPKKRRVRDAPQAAPSHRRGGGTGRVGKAGDQGRASKTAICQALDVASGPLTSGELAERVPLNVSTITEKLRELSREGTVVETEKARGPHPSRWALPSRLAEWDDPDEVDDEDADEEPVLPGEEPPPVADEEEHEAHHATVLPNVSARVRKQLERDRAQPAVADVDESDRRPTGERLVRVVVEQLDGTRAKPREVARDLVLPAPEVAQAIRVAQDRGWVERCDDGTFTATGAMTATSNGTVVAA